MAQVVVALRRVRRVRCRTSGAVPRLAKVQGHVAADQHVRQREQQAAQAAHQRADAQPAGLVPVATEVADEYYKEQGGDVAGRYYHARLDAAQFEPLLKGRQARCC